VDARCDCLRGVRPDVRRRGEGETFDSIADRIPAIAELGVDTLWLTPVLQHDGKPHGYNITDFFDVAEDLGERDDYEALVETAHDTGCGYFSTSSPITPHATTSGSRTPTGIRTLRTATATTGKSRASRGRTSTGS